MKRHLQCAEQQVSPSNLTKYCACHEKWLDCFIVLTYETSFPMRGATGVTIQPHQILRLPRKMTLQDFKENLQKQMKRHFQCGADPSMIRPWSDHENANRNPPRKWGYFSSSPRAFSIEKYNVSRPILHSNLHQILRLPRKVPLELHQILRLSRRKTHILSPHRIWNVIYSARSNRCHHPTSPNTAPATKNDSTALSSSHMKRHFQCAEQQVSPSNLTKYCACHEKWLDCFIVLTYETSFPMRGATGVTIQPHQILRLPRKMTLQDFKENLPKQVKRHFQCGADPSMIRAWSDHENANRNPPRKWGYFSSSPRAFSIEKYNVSRPILHSNLHQILRLPRKVPLELHQILRLSRRKTHILSPHRIWNVIYSARSNRCHHPTSPNTAPATKNDSTALSSSHMKRHFQCAEQQVSPSNLTKYCACHEKWLDCFIVLTYETSFPMRGATGVTIQPHQILRLPRKMTLQDFKENLQKQVKRHFQCGADPSMIRAWSDHENANRNPPRKWGYFSSSPRAFSIEKYNVSRPILHSNLHQILRLPRKVPLELHQILRLPRKVTLELHQVLRLPRKVTLELHQVLRRPLYCNWTLLYSTLLDTTLRDTTLRDTTLRDTTLLDSTLLDSTLLDSTWHYSTWHYSTWHYSTWLYSTWLYSTWLYLTLLYVTLLYLAPILLDSTLLDLLHLTLLYVTLLYLTLLYLTLLYLTLLDTTLRDTTLLGSYSTWLYSTWPAPLDLTLLRCCSYIGSFST